MNALLIAVLAAGLAQTPARDGARAVPVGTGAVSGIVTTDTAKPQPLRKARVTLAASDINFSRTIVTGDNGTFTFTNLPAGRFTLTAMKEAFTTLAFGARQPGRPGTSLVLSDGERLENLAIRLPRGAVITGTITDFLGRPVPDVSVSAAQYGFMSGTRRLLSQASGSTDDRGTYRIYGLRPGQYVVSASPDRMFMMFSNTPDLLHQSEADVTRAAQETPATGASARVGRPVGYTSIYFPNATTAAQAATITLEAGEVRTAVDIQLSLVPSGRVEGTVSYSGGSLPPVVQVTVAAAGRDLAGSAGMDGIRMVRAVDGKFQAGALAPGEYIVAARANAPGDKSGESALWASERVFVDGEAAPVVHLELQRGLTVSGRVDFQAGGTTAPDLRGWRVGLTAMSTDLVIGVNAVEVQTDGTFAIRGATPGRYRLTMMPPGAAAGDKWMPKEAIVSGRNALDDAFDVVGDVTGIAVVVTDKLSQISGTLQDASGAPASDYHIIVFPADRSMWGPLSRRVQAIRPAANGSYIVKRLPPGEYLLAAVIDVEPGEWTDPAFLERMAKASMPFTLAEGEQKVQDLRLGGR